MSVVRRVLASPRGRWVLAAIAAWLAWQAWLSVAAPAKIDPGFASGAEKVNIRVTLPFPPERFHVLVFQSFGRVSGTEDNTIEVRGVKRADLRALARPYWVSRVAPLPTE